MSRCVGGITSIVPGKLRLKVCFSMVFELDVSFQLVGIAAALLQTLDSEGPFDNISLLLTIGLISLLRIACHSGSNP